MTLTIELTPQEESRLRSAAKREGIPPADLAKRIVSAHLPDGSSYNGEEPTEDPTIALFRKWEEEDANMTLEEIEQENRDLEELMENLNANRRAAGERLIFPE